MVGVSGIGKSTACSRLESEVPGLVWLGFGDYLQKVLGDSVRDRADMRRSADRVISGPVLDAACASLRNDLFAMSSEEVDVLVEMRVAASRSYGFRSFPIARRVVEGIGCCALFGLDAEASEVLSRSESGVSGRDELDLAWVERQAALERAFAVATSVHLDCPLYWIDAGREVDHVVADIKSVISEVRLTTFRPAN